MAFASARKNVAAKVREATNLSAGPASIVAEFAIGPLLNCQPKAIYHYWENAIPSRILVDAANERIYLYCDTRGNYRFDVRKDGKPEEFTVYYLERKNKQQDMKQFVIRADIDDICVGPKGQLITVEPGRVVYRDGKTGKEKRTRRIVDEVKDGITLGYCACYLATGDLFLSYRQLQNREHGILHVNNKDQKKKIPHPSCQWKNHLHNYIQNLQIDQETGRIGFLCGTERRCAWFCDPQPSTGTWAVTHQLELKGEIAYSLNFHGPFLYMDIDRKFVAIDRQTGQLIGQFLRVDCSEMDIHSCVAGNTLYVLVRKRKLLLFE